MRSLSWGSGLVLSLLFTATSVASIEEWGGALPGTYDIDPVDRTITILQPGVFKFWATNEGNRDINSITVDPNIADGLVALTVRAPEGAPGFPVGAMNVHLLDLSNASSSRVEKLTIANALGRDGALRCGDISEWCWAQGGYLSDVVLEGLSGELKGVGARDISIIGGLTAPGGGSIIIGDGGYQHSYTGNIFASVPLHDIQLADGIRFIGGTISCEHSIDTLALGPVEDNATVVVQGSTSSLHVGDFLSGSIKILGNGHMSWLAMGGLFGDAASLDISGSVWGAYLWAEMGGRLDIAGDVVLVDMYRLPAGGDVRVGSLSGLLTIQDHFGGSFRVDGDVTGSVNVAPIENVFSVGGVLSATLRVNPGLQDEEYGDIRGELHIGGALLGDVTVTGTLRDGGHIRIDGGFGDSTHVARIELGQTIVGENCYVTVDYDGWHEEDEWDPNSYILYQGQSYHGNTPGLPFYRITSCRGDMLNDGLCDFYDIDALIEAFGDGATYNANYPGLAGSRTWHGDLNCDSVVDFYDIDGFVARLGWCTPDCYEGDNLQGGGEGPQMQTMGGGGAAAIAAQLAASVSAENMPALIAAIEQLALNPPANSAVDWSAVLAALGGCESGE